MLHIFSASHVSPSAKIEPNTMEEREIGATYQTAHNGTEPPVTPHLNPAIGGDNITAALNEARSYPDLFIPILNPHKWIFRDHIPSFVVLPVISNNILFAACQSKCFPHIYWLLSNPHTATPVTL